MNKKFLVASLLSQLFSLVANASTGEIYGYGSRASALGNTMNGSDDSGYATFYNPAINSTRKGFSASLSAMWLDPHFTSINGIVVKNSVFNPTGSTVSGDVPNNDYNDQIGQALGVSYGLGEKFYHTAIGVAGYMPIERIAYLDTGESYKPEYFSYRSRTQRPQIYTSVSMSPVSHLYVGAGLSVAFNMDANATILTTASSNSASSARFSAAMKPNVAPYFGIFTKWDLVDAGVTFRLKNRSKASLDTGADAKIFGSAGSFSVALNAASSMYYDPMEVDIAAAWHITHKSTVITELDWFEYGAFEVPTLTISKTSGGSIDMQNSISTAPVLQSIFVPKLGFEHVWGKITGRLGAAYRPSPVKDNSGVGNLVDPAKVIGSAGFGFDLNKFGITDNKVRIDIHGQFHYLFKKSIVKTNNDELGNSGQQKIGYPGYDIGGYIYGGGLTATVEL